MVKEITRFMARDNEVFSSLIGARHHEAELDIENWIDKNSCYRELNESAILDDPETLHKLLGHLLALKGELNK